MKTINSKDLIKHQVIYTVSLDNLGKGTVTYLYSEDEVKIGDYENVQFVDEYGNFMERHGRVTKILRIQYLNENGSFETVKITNKKKVKQ